MKMRDNHLVSKTKYNANINRRRELQIIQRGFPENFEHAGLDPQVKAFLESREKTTDHRPMGIDDLEAIRSRKEANNKNLSTNIIIEYKTIHLSDRDLDIRIYNRTKKVKPGIVFYHGGGFLTKTHS